MNNKMQTENSPDKTPKATEAVSAFIDKLIENPNLVSSETLSSLEIKDIIINGKQVLTSLNVLKQLKFRNGHLIIEGSLVLDPAQKKIETLEEQEAFDQLHSFGSMISEQPYEGFKNIVCTLSDDRKLTSAQAIITHMNGVTIELTLSHWVISAELTPPLIVVGQLQLLVEDDRPPIGNLQIYYGEESWTLNNFQLEGVRYTYYLIFNQKHSFLLIDTKSDEKPDPELVNQEFRAIQFVLGLPMKIPFLCAFNTEGFPNSWRHGFLAISSSLEHAVPPLGVNPEGTAELFKVLCTALNDKKRKQDTLRLGIPITSYFQSLTAVTLEHQYLVLQVALEAFSYWIKEGKKSIAKKTTKSLVNLPKDWAAWVETKSSEIKQFAALRCEDALLKKVKNAHFESTGRLVRQVCEQLNIPLEGKALFGINVLEEIEGRQKSKAITEQDNTTDPDSTGRNIIAHMFEMSPNGYDIERDENRITLLRTLLVKMITSVVGYKEPIPMWD